MEIMIPFHLRFAILGHPQVFANTAVAAAAGFFTILGYGQKQMVSFILSSPAPAPVEGMLREVIPESYVEFAFAWVAAALGMAWGFVGKQAKLARQMINRR